MTGKVRGASKRTRERVGDKRKIRKRGRVSQLKILICFFPSLLRLVFLSMCFSQRRLEEGLSG